MAVGQRTEHVDLCGRPSNAAHSAIAVALCVTITGTSTPGQVVEQAPGPLAATLLAGFPAPTADVAAGHPVGELVRKALLRPRRGSRPSQCPSDRSRKRASVCIGRPVTAPIGAAVCKARVAGRRR